MKLASRWVCMALAVLFIAGGVVRGQVLDQVPATAHIVVKIKDLAGTSAKVSKLATDLGVGQMVPNMADPLGWLMQKAGIKDGVDKNGDLAFAMIPPDDQAAGGQPTAIILIPVTDYKAFIANYPDAKTEAGVTTVKFPEQTDPGYIANWGNYAAVSNKQDAVAARPTATIKLDAASAKEMADRDIVMFVNLPVVKAKILAAMASAKQNMLGIFDEQFRARPQSEKFVPVLDALFNQIFAKFEQIIQDGQGATLSLNLGAEGISIAGQAAFAPDSYYGKLASQIKDTGDSLVAGLPQAKYMAVGGLQVDPAVICPVVKDFITPIQDAANKGGDDLKPLSEMMDALQQSFSAVHTESFGMLQPSLAATQPGQSPIIQWLACVEGDSAIMKAAQKKMQMSQQDFIKALGLPGSDTTNVTYTPNAKTLDGVSFDSMATTVDVSGGSPAAQAQAHVMSMMYGSNGLVIYSGALDAQHFLMASGVTDGQISSLISCVKSGQSPVADDAGIKGVAGNLPASRFVACYVSLGDIASTIVSYAKQLGLPIPVTLPPDLPPIGITISSDHASLRDECYIPTSLVQGLVAAGMQAYLQFQQGGGGGL